MSEVTNLMSAMSAMSEPEETTELGGLMFAAPTSAPATFRGQPLGETATAVEPTSEWQQAYGDAYNSDTLLGRMSTLPIPRPGYHLAEAIREIVAGMRYLHGQTFVLPPQIEALIKQQAIVPVCVRSMFGGGHDLARLLGSFTDGDRKYLRVEPSEHQEEALKDGTILIRTGLPANPIKVGDIAEAILLPHLKTNGTKGTGRAPSKIGFERREAWPLAKLVARCLRFIDCEGLIVVVPTEVYKAVDLFLKTGADGTPVACKCNFVEIPTNWLMPACGLEYSRVESAFAHLEAAVERNYLSNRGGRRPVTYVQTEAGFDLILSGGARFKIVAPTEVSKARVYLQAAGSLAVYELRPFVATVPKTVGTIPTDYLVKLESLDALWYAFEAYGFAWLNREVTNKFGDSDMLGTYFTRFVLTCMPVQYQQYERDLSAASNRELLTDNKYSLAAVAMPMPLTIVRKYGGTHGFLTPAGAYLASSSSSLNNYYKDISSAASLMRYHSQDLNVLGAIEPCALALDLTIAPIGSCKDFLGSSLLLATYSGKDRARGKRHVIKLLSKVWQDSFAAKLGAFDADDNVKLVEALWSKFDVDAQAVGIKLQDAQGPKSAEFWELVIDRLGVVKSSKKSKAVKRVSSTHADTLPSNRDVTYGYRTHVHQSNTGALVKAIVAPSMLSMPGMARMSIGALKGYYTQKQQLVKAVLPTGVKAMWMELEEALSSVATESFVADEDGDRFVGWKFPAKTLVTDSTVIGRVMMLDEFGQHVEHSLIKAGLKEGTKANLEEVVFDFKVDLGGERQFYAFGKFKNQIVDALKLRSVCGAKATTLAVKMWHALGMLNGGVTDNVELFLYGDSYKGSDNLTSIVKLAGINYAYYADAHPEMSALLVATNHAVNRHLDLPNEDNSKWLHLVDDAVPLGIYDELVADFERRFCTDFWHYERTPNLGLPAIRMSQTHDRAVASAYAALQPNATLKGKAAPWRFVGSAEAATIRGRDGKGLPKELLFDIEVREREGGYGQASSVGSAYIVTDAVGKLDVKSCISCAWSAVGLDGNVTYHMLDRTYGWGPKNGLDLMFPVEVEAGTIAEALTSTRPMPFAAVIQSLEGKSSATERHLMAAARNVEFDGLLRSFISGVKVESSTEEGGEVDLTHSGMTAAVLFDNDKESLAKLCAPEVYLDDMAFLTAISKLAEENTFRLPLSDRGMTESVVVHIGTLLEWNAGSLLHKGDTAVSCLATYLKYWIVFGKDQHAPDMLMLADSIQRMLNAYYLGKNHMKSLLRGETSVYAKAAACTLVPDDEIWITAATARHFARVYGCTIDKVTHVGFRRMPMFQAWVGKIRVLSNEDVSSYRKTHGVLFVGSLVYMGSLAMYVNFGDLDGDAIEVANYSYEVATGTLELSSFDTTADMLSRVLGYDFRNWEHWLGNAPDQYVTDHFHVPGWAKFQRKSGLSWSANCMTKCQFAEFGLAAASVQTVTVGLTYRVAVLTLLFAEIVPVIADRLVSLNGDTQPEWLNSMSWLLDRDEALLTVQRLLQLYEIALGGYDEDMAVVTLGYLIRALNGEREIAPNTPSFIAAGLACPETSDFSSLQPEAKKFRQFSHLPEAKVREAMANLGFAAGDLAKFRNCFLLMGVCGNYKRNTESEEITKHISAELQVIFTIIQTVLDISQAKLDVMDEGSDEEAIDLQSLVNHAALTAEIAQDLEVESDPANATFLAGLLDLDIDIRNNSVAGKMFELYRANNERVNSEEGVFTVAKLVS